MKKVNVITCEDMDMTMNKQQAVMFMLSNINMPICYFEMNRCGEDDPIEDLDNNIVIAQFAATMPNIKTGCLNEKTQQVLYNVGVRVDCGEPYIIINNIR